MDKSVYKINPAAPLFSVKEVAKNTVKKPVYHYALFGIILAVLQALYMNGAGNVTFMGMLKSVMAYSIMSIGYCFLLGYAGLASLGTAGFVGVGIYITYFSIANWGLPPIVAVILAIIIAVVLGVVVGFISLRIEGIYLAIITLGLAEVLRYVLKAISSQGMVLSTKQLDFLGINIGVNGMFFVVCVMLVFLMIIIHNLINSPTGRGMIAMKNSTSASQAFGISLMKYRLLAFVVATIFATLGGVAFMLVGNSISPSSEGDTTLKLTLSLNILGAVIIGGHKSIWGAAFGSLVVFGLSMLAVAFLPYSVYQALNPYISVIIGVLIIVIVMFYAGGLAQLMGTLKVQCKKLFRKIKEARYGRDV